MSVFRTFAQILDSVACATSGQTHLWALATFDYDLEPDLVEAHEPKREAGEECRQTNEKE